MAFRFQFMGICVILDKHISGFSSDKLAQFTKKGRFFSRGISHVKRTVPNSPYKYDGSNPPLAFCADISGLDSL